MNFYTRDSLGLDEILSTFPKTRDQFFNNSAVSGHRPISPLAAFAAARRHSVTLASDSTSLCTIPGSSECIREKRKSKCDGDGDGDIDRDGDGGGWAMEEVEGGFL
ncbi:hypothetical protein LXL04_038233 [Taraxacum kok-saghyz]